MVRGRNRLKKLVLLTKKPVAIRKGDGILCFEMMKILVPGR
jgi:hypothetical protein